MNWHDPRVSVTPAVEEIINLKVYNNDCIYYIDILWNNSAVSKICAFSIKHIFTMGMQPK